MDTLPEPQSKRAIEPDTLAAALPRLHPQRRALFRRFLRELDAAQISSDAMDRLDIVHALGLRFVGQRTAHAERVSTNGHLARPGEWLRLLDRWRWSPDEADPDPRVLTPELLAYVAQYSGPRKALGAFYTAPDVTVYLCENALLPRVLELAGISLLSPLLQGEPTSYLRRSICRPGWLPMETGEERAVRLRRLCETCSAIEAGRVATVEAAITCNLDLTRITLDCVRSLEPLRRQALLAELTGLRVLDPTCGAGDFLLAALDLLLKLGRACLEPSASPSALAAFTCTLLTDTLCGVDILPEAVEACRLRLVLRAAVLAPAITPAEVEALAGAPLPLRVADVLAPIEPSPGAPEFDVVLGNPPYVPLGPDRPAHLARYRTGACGNLYAPVVERSLELLKPGGRLGMVMPVSAVSGEEYAPLAALLLDGRCWVATFSNRPAKLFEGVEQRLAIVLREPGPAEVHTSAYQHWYQAERPHLLERLTYSPAPRWSASGMPAKTGTPLASAMFEKLTAHSGRLGELEGPGTAAVWLHDGPTYWVRALPFAPNAGLPESRSGHYHRIPVSDEDSAHLLAVLLSSSTFYLFYKMVSNCRDLGRGEWSRFPFDPPPAELREELVSLGREYAGRLRETARLRRRRYPSGEVAYHEYYPAQAKEVLDRIDGVLARHYGFTAEELEYVRSCDLKYRMGAGAAG